VVTNCHSFKGKWKVRGKKQIVIGYGHDQSRDTYNFLHPVTKAIRTSRDVKWLPSIKLDPKQDMSVFKKDTELSELPMGLDGIEKFYLAPEFTPAPPAPNLITDDTYMHLEAGRILEQDASMSNAPNEQLVSDDKEANEPESKKQKLAVEKAIEKGECWDQELRKLASSYNPMQN
jgi:hypothetical protein